MAGAATPDGEVVMAIVPREAYKIIEGSWGDLIGLKGSGSHSVVVEEEVFVPAHQVIPIKQFFAVGQRPSPGLVLHGNPTFHGNHLAFAGTEIVAVNVGAADALAELLERPNKFDGSSLGTNPDCRRQVP